MLETHVAEEWPIIHEDFPEFPQGVFSQLHCSRTVYIFCPRPSRGLFHFVFPASPPTPVIGATKLDRLSNYIFWHKFPKHTFLNQLPWRLPGGCRQTAAPGRTRFHDSTDSKCVSCKRGNSQAQKCSQADRGASVSVTTSVEPDHIAEALVPMSLF